MVMMMMLIILGLWQITCGLRLRLSHLRCGLNWYVPIRCELILRCNLCSSRSALRCHLRVKPGARLVILDFNPQMVVEFTKAEILHRGYNLDNNRFLKGNIYMLLLLLILCSAVICSTDQNISGLLKGPVRSSNISGEMYGVFLGLFLAADWFLLSGKSSCCSWSVCFWSFSSFNPSFQIPLRLSEFSSKRNGHFASKYISFLNVHL